VLILERERHIGGRMGTENFHGTQIAIGAGIGRKRKDTYLQTLIQELNQNTECNIPTREFKTKTQYATTITGSCDIKPTFLQLKETYKKTSPKNTTFREFAEKILGKNAYQHFTTCAGFTDYENENVENTLYHYGFNDNYENWTGIGVPWNILLDSLKKVIGSGQIRTSKTVEKITQESGTFQWNVHVSNVNSSTVSNYLAKQVILATTIDSVCKLVPGANQIHSPFRHIRGQPFLRIYGKFSTESAKIIQEYIHPNHIMVVPGPIHKMISIEPQKGIYMIVYTDNAGAKTLKKYAENTAENRKTLCRMIQTGLNIPDHKLELEDIRSFYWSIGTHYYRPGKLPSQNPHPQMYVVGEMISNHQGWVEGALESVENVWRNYEKMSL
jgi:hypothetical protein